MLVFFNLICCPRYFCSPHSLYMLPFPSCVNSILLKCLLRWNLICGYPFQEFYFRFHFADGLQEGNAMYFSSSVFLVPFPGKNYSYLFIMNEWFWEISSNYVSQFSCSALDFPFRDPIIDSNTPYGTTFQKWNKLKLLTKHIPIHE